MKKSFLKNRVLLLLATVLCSSYMAFASLAYSPCATKNKAGNKQVCQVAAKPLPLSNPLQMVFSKIL